MNLMNSKTLIIVGFVVIAAVTISSVGLAGLLFTPTSYGQNFLLQLMERNEDAALEYLTPAFRDVVRSSCPNAAVTDCFWVPIDAAWGDLEGIQFVRSDASGVRELFHLKWSGLPSPVSVVLYTRQIEGSYLVDGWRGFIIRAGAAVDDALLLGESDDGVVLVPGDGDE